MNQRNLLETKKNHIRETLNLLTCVYSSTDTIKFPFLALFPHFLKLLKFCNFLARSDRGGGGGPKRPFSERLANRRSPLGKKLPAMAQQTTTYVRQKLRHTDYENRYDQQIQLHNFFFTTPFNLLCLFFQYFVVSLLSYSLI